MGLAKRCPRCKIGRLTYPICIERDLCMSCILTADNRIKPQPAQRFPFRSEAETYEEGIFDDD